MEKELKTINEPEPTKIDPAPKRTRHTDLPPVDICLLGLVGFYRNLTQPDAIAFTTSLYEIDQILASKEAETDPQELTDEELVAQRLPLVYQDFADVFSKAVSDVLPPHRLYDYKIQLEKENTLGYSPLY